MPPNHILNAKKRDPVPDDTEDTRSLLRGSSNNDPAVDVDDHDSPRLRPSRRQSPLQTQAPPRTPRTKNRVRFNLTENQHAANHTIEAAAEEGDEEDRGDDYLAHHHLSTAAAALRAPLLTGIEAPRVAATSTSLRLNIEEVLEDVNRPKSGMMSAFMNMANSIM
jgi:sodium-coupled neutral amino acid transporter 11